MLKRIRALNELEFEEAKANEAVYGKYRELYVYVTLGSENIYLEHPTDNPKTQYRLFKKCTIEYSETED